MFFGCCFPSHLQQAGTNNVNLIQYKILVLNNSWAIYYVIIIRYVKVAYMSSLFYVLHLSLLMVCMPPEEALIKLETRREKYHLISNVFCCIRDANFPEILPYDQHL